MMDFVDFAAQAPTRPLSQMDKAAAVLLAMGKPVAGKLLKFFTQSELQSIIASAQSLRLCIWGGEFRNRKTASKKLLQFAWACNAGPRWWRKKTR